MYWFVDCFVVFFPSLEYKLQEEEILLYPQPVLLFTAESPVPT